MAKTENHHHVQGLISALVSLAVAIGLAATAGAQSLAEVAKKERERREKLEASEGETPTITDVELRRAGDSGTLPTSRTTTADSGDDEAGGETEPEEDTEEAAEAADPRQTEAYWRGRLQPIDERIQRLETQLQSPQYTMNPVGGPERQRLEQQLERARAQRQAVLDEARRAGVPPGWLR